MKKQQKQMLILLLVLVLLGAGFLGIRKYKEVQNEQPVEEDSIIVVEFDDEAIVRFAYDYQDVQHALEKKEDEWCYVGEGVLKDTSAEETTGDVTTVAEAIGDTVQTGASEQGNETTVDTGADDTFVENKEFTIDQSRIKTMISKVAPLEVVQVIENVTDKSQYGLTEPSGDITRIQYETAAESIVLEVGNYNSLTNIYYVSMPASSTVYAVNGPVITGFHKTLEDLVEEENTTENE